MSKVRFVKGSRAAFEALSEKDGGVIYFVNETGDFSPSSLDGGGELYLGDKLISGNSAPIENQPGDGGLILPGKLYSLGSLGSDLSLKAGGFTADKAAEWHVVFSTGTTPHAVTIAVDGGSATCTILGNMPTIQADKTYEVSLLYAGGTTASSKTSLLFLLKCDQY